METSLGNLQDVAIDSEIVELIAKGRREIGTQATMISGPSWKASFQTKPLDQWERSEGNLPRSISISIGRIWTRKEYLGVPSFRTVCPTDQEHGESLANLRTVTKKTRETRNTSHEGQQRHSGSSGDSHIKIGDREGSEVRRFDSLREENCMRGTQRIWG